MDIYSDKDLFCLFHDVFFYFDEKLNNDDEYDIDIRCSEDGDIGIALSDKYLKDKLTSEEIREAVIRKAKSLKFFADLNVDRACNELKILSFILDNDIDILDYEKVYVMYDQKCAALVENNEFFNNTIININHKFNIDSKELDELVDMFGDKDNLRVFFSERDRYVSIDEFKNIIDIMDSTVDQINKYDLSPLEKVLYAYDLVRDRVYQMGDDEVDPLQSRALSQVLTGDKIVCAGYVQIFNTLLEKLGFDCGLCHLEKKENGHARSIAYIKDEKYGIDGIYMFDPTWDSKKEEDDRSYLESYKYFCKTISSFKLTDVGYKNKTFSSHPHKLTSEFIKYYEDGEFDKITAEMARNISKIYELFCDGKLIKPTFYDLLAMEAPSALLRFSIDPKEFLRFKELSEKLFVNDVEQSKLLRAIYNVRKVEYYEDPDKYPFDMETFKSIFIDNAIDGKLTGTSRMLYSIFCSKMFDESDFEDEAEKLDLEKNIGLVKVTKTLKKVAEKKGRENK